LTFSANVTNGALFATPPVVSGSTLTFDFAPNQSGTSVVTVTAQDTGGATAVTNFNVNGTGQKNPPVAGGSIPDVTVAEDSGSQTINLAGLFTDADIATNGDSLTVTAVPSNPVLFGPPT